MLWQVSDKTRTERAMGGVDMIGRRKQFIGVDMAKLRSLSVLLGAAALLALAAPTAARATDHKPAACEDHTPHEIRMVKVAPGVELEVLDWGGRGKALVLLAEAVPG